MKRSPPLTFRQVLMNQAIARVSSALNQAILSAERNPREWNKPEVRQGLQTLLESIQGFNRKPK